MRPRTLGLGLLIVGLVTVVAWMLSPDTQPMRTAERGTAEPPADSSTEVPGALPPVRSAREEPPARDAEGFLLPAELAPTLDELRAARAPAPRVPVRGRILDRDGNALVGVRVAASHWADEGWIEVVRSGEDGRFAFEWQPPDLLSFAFEHEGYATELLDSSDWGYRGAGGVFLGDICMEAGAVAAGSVVDESGRPVGRASLAVRSLTSQEGQIVLPLRTDEDGRFRRIGIPMGRCILSARSGDRYGSSDLIEVRAGRVAEVRIVVRPDPTHRAVSGRVLSADGLPLEGVRVGCEFETETTSTGGRFRIVCRAGETVRLQVFDPKQRYAPLTSEELVAGSEDVELLLAPLTWFEVALLDEGGATIPWGHVTLTPLVIPGKEPQILGSMGYAGHNEITRIDFDSRGRARCPLPDRAFALRADAPGFRPVELGPFEPEAVGARLEVVLAPGHFVRGRVRHAGRPVAGASVALSRDELSAARESVGRTPLGHFFAVTRIASLGQDDGSTDADGRFLIAVHDDGRYTLRVSAPGLGHALFGPYAIDRERGLADLDLEIAAPGAIEGRVLVAPGATPAGRLVGASNGTRLVCAVGADEEGRYRLDDLQPGEYQVRPLLPPVASWQALEVGAECAFPVIWDGRVRSSETTRLDLDLRDEGSCVLVGRVAFSGVFESAWEGRLQQGRRLLARGPFSEAEYRLAVDEEGPYDFILYRSGDGPIELPVELVRGESRRDLVVAYGRLHLVARSRAGENRSLELTREAAGAGLQVTRKLWVSPEGLDRTIALPTGTYRWSTGLADEARDLGRFEVRLGEETLLRVPE